MRYNQGDCLSFKGTDGIFMAGFIHMIQGDKYMIALSDYREEDEPLPDYFSNCLLFSVVYEMGDKAIYSLDVFAMDIEFTDNAIDISLVTHIDLPGLIGSSGFQWVKDTAALPVHFMEGIEMRMDGFSPDKDSQRMKFGRKCFRRIKDFFDEVPPQNQFPTVKLYRDVEGVTHYWQIYGSSIDQIGLVIHWGVVGGKGEFIEITDHPLDDVKKIYRSEIEERNKEGFIEAQWQRMILQLGTSDEWGSLDDLKFRNEIWEYLDPVLFWSGNGQISGGDIGSGSVNLFFESVKADAAVNSILLALEEKNIKQPFLIALEIQSGEDNGDFEVNVIYPREYQGSFVY